MVRANVRTLNGTDKSLFTQKTLQYCSQTLKVASSNISWVKKLMVCRFALAEDDYV